MKITAAVLLAIFMLQGPRLAAQEMTPRAYWPAPKGTRIATIGLSHVSGDTIPDLCMANYNFDQKFNQLARHLQITTQPVVPDIPVTNPTPPSPCGLSRESSTSTKTGRSAVVIPGGIGPFPPTTLHILCPKVFMESYKGATNHHLETTNQPALLDVPVTPACLVSEERRSSVSQTRYPSSTYCHTARYSHHQSRHNLGLGYQKKPLAFFSLLPTLSTHPPTMGTFS